ncbi:MAG: bifunctional aspartate transaminase/aspartate 4-decarboxylase, partial [Victivallales bacterium]|nr:bifunctional aspartate transaminase/aspartate 4-decarboxylase [Victivallales bacterium]
FLLGSFAIEEARRDLSRVGLAGIPSLKGAGQRFEDFCRFHSDRVGSQFLINAYKYVTETLGLDGDEFITEMTDGILGDNYPVPDRILKNVSKIVDAYILDTMCNLELPPGKIDYFAVEGGTAAMTYVFNTLKENYLLCPGDKIALGTPIFTPYLEIPELKDYELEIVEIKMDENNDWKYSEKELEKLLDPDIKAFFVVNPSNPPSTSMSKEALEKIKTIINTKRKDLIILTDDVYGTFVEDFKSLAAIVPKNTILVYSYSKYFGCTGWRLGVIGIHKDNVLDKMIASLPKEKRVGIHNRYESISPDPENIKLIDRLVADSRAVALNHTAGLSTPQQVMMTLFSLQELIDSDSRLYRKCMKDLIKVRYDELYKAMEVEPPNLPSYAMYYTTIDIPHLAEKLYSKKFADWLKSEHEPIDFVWRLANNKGVVLMDGGGFSAPEMSVRVSLANLDTKDYKKVGKAVKELLAEYYEAWKW